MSMKPGVYKRCKTSKCYKMAEDEGYFCRSCNEALFGKLNTQIIEPKVRKCLFCLQPMNSEWAGHRIHTNCKKAAEFIHGEESATEYNLNFGTVSKVPKG